MIPRCDDVAVEVCHRSRIDSNLSGALPVLLVLWLGINRDFKSSTIAVFTAYLGNRIGALKV